PARGARGGAARGLGGRRGERVRRGERLRRPGTGHGRDDGDGAARRLLPEQALGHMYRTCFTLAFHPSPLGALAYLALLAQGWRGLAWVARGLTLGGWVLHGIGLFLVLSTQRWVPSGFGQVVSLLAFLLIAVFLVVDLRARAALLGAFLSPAAVAVLVPSLWIGARAPELSEGLRQPLLPVHIAVALAGLAVFGVATAVARGDP